MQICDYKHECTGCGACSKVCPAHSINMVANAEGFLEPNIDELSCIKCGKCSKICPSGKSFKNNFALNELQAFSFTGNDADALKESSSGGAFSALAQEVIKRGGVVFGAKFDENYNVIQTGIDKLENMNAIRGSKYVQSDTKDTYLEAKRYLADSRIVLYVGTPCQIAGLYAALGYKDYENLFTVDILCHGVPSGALFKSYIAYLEDKYGKITSYLFRDKTKYGWGHWGSFKHTDSRSKNHIKYFVVANDYFYSLYFKECNFRECCYSCKYAALPRIADITLGDCWGIEEINPRAYSKKGVSLILINNEKGRALFDHSIRHDQVTSLNANDVIKYNMTIVSPAKRPPSRDTFYDDYIKFGFEESAKRYCRLKHVVPIVARYIPRGIKRTLKKLLKG